MTVATASAPNTTMVGMGQAFVAEKSDLLSSVLGSCIGVAIYHPRMQVGAMAHVVLPDSNGRIGTPGKFADTAVPYLIEQLRRKGVPPTGLVAKITGGACMFGVGGPLQIGDMNIKAVSDALNAANVRLEAQDVGGTSGRRVTFEVGSGKMTVATVGNPPKIL